MNQCNFTGEPTKPPRLLCGKKDKLTAYFTLKVKKEFPLKGVMYDYIPCISSGRIAEDVKKYVRRGTHLLIQGRWENNNYVNNNGEEVIGQQLVIKKMEFLEEVREKKESEILIEEATTSSAYDFMNAEKTPFDNEEKSNGDAK